MPFQRTVLNFMEQWNINGWPNMSWWTGNFRFLQRPTTCESLCRLKGRKHKKKTRPGKTAPEHFDKKKTFSRRSRKSPKPLLHPYTGSCNPVRMGRLFFTCALAWEQARGFFCWEPGSNPGGEANNPTPQPHELLLVPKEENTKRCEDTYTLKPCVEHIQSIPTHKLENVNHSTISTRRFIATSSVKIILH